MLIACQHWVQKPIKFLPAPTFPSTKLSKYGPKVNISALTRSKIKKQIWILWVLIAVCSRVTTYILGILRM